MALSDRLVTIARRVLGSFKGNEFVSLVESEVPLLAGGTSNASQTFSVDPKTSVGVGAAAGTGVTAAEYGNGAVHKTVLTLASTSVATTDAGVSGAYGGLKIYDFPEGVIQILGASYNLTTARSSTGITTTAAVVGSLGSVTAGADATLTSTEADIIDSTTGTLSSGAGVLKKHGSINTTAFDGHTTPLDMYLNVAMPDAGSSANDAIVCSGTVTVTWANLGDY